MSSSDLEQRFSDKFNRPQSSELAKVQPDPTSELCPEGLHFPETPGEANSPAAKVPKRMSPTSEK